ncbi:origin recognition complex subunit 3 N-terminus-domain-containing protein [Spinellus fusiger]|nr:origin recognition complex subunit 3 N-terminus-domain-containing protein [Spinellus fusiger]
MTDKEESPSLCSTPVEVALKALEAQVRALQTLHQQKQLHHQHPPPETPSSTTTESAIAEEIVALQAENARAEYRIQCLIRALEEKDRLLKKKVWLGAREEGCFLVMPGSAQHPQKKRKKASAKAKATSLSKIQPSTKEKAAALEGFQRLWDGDEPPHTMLLRQQTFENTWEETSNIIEAVMLDMNHTALHDICTFVEKAHSKNNAKGLIALPFHEIPTGLVFAGINTSDHTTPFLHLASLLKASASPAYSCLLQSKDCSTLQGMMKHMMDQFMALKVQKYTYTDNDEDIEEEEQEEKALNYQLSTDNGSTACKLQNHDLRMLEAWYRHTIGKSTSADPPLVVILQDFELFSPDILQNFIMICSEYRLSLPIVLVFGIATSTEIIHQSLNKSTLSLLRIEKFWLQQSEAWFNRVLETVFLETPSTLKFGARPYKFLLDQFYLYDFSMSKFKACLKYALMHYFYGNPLSIFFSLMKNSQHEMKMELSSWWKYELLTKDHTNNLRMLPSFKTHVESLCEEQPAMALKLLTDDQFLLTEALPDLLWGLEMYRQEFQFGLDLIQLLQGHFAAFSVLRKPKRMLFLQALENRQGLDTTSDVTKWLVSLVRKMEPEKLEVLLQELYVLVENPKYSAFHATLSFPLSLWKQRLEICLAKPQVSTPRREDQAIVSGIILSDLEKRETATSKKAQREAIDHLKHEGLETSRIVMELADWIVQLFSQHLRSYTCMPMHELIYYTNVKLHEKSFAAQPRASVQTALTQPKHYLDCSCCGGAHGSLLPSEPDSCILYKLYLECGRMINLYDWFVAFGSVLEREKRETSLEEDEVQTRFIRSVAELQFLGFIKPTQRKTDHVVRLTWSNIE